MSYDDSKNSIDIQKEVPSIESFRNLSVNQLEEKKPIMPYLYEKEKENGQWISYHKSDPSIHYPFVPPYTYIKSDVIVYTVNEDGYKEAKIVPIQDKAYYEIPPLKWGNPFMCHAFFDMITGAKYGNEHKIALNEFYESIQRVPSANKEHYLSIFNKNWESGNILLYGTRTHAIVIVRENDSIIVINSGDGINNHPKHQTNRNLYQLVCKFKMINNPKDDSDTFDERWKLIKYQASHEDEVQPDKETLYSKFLAFLQHGFNTYDKTSPSTRFFKRFFNTYDKTSLSTRLFGILDSKPREITWDTQPLFPDLIIKKIQYTKIEYRLHEREMLIDGGFLYGTPQVSGSCTFHSIFWHYIYLLIINSKSVPNWFSTWNIYNWEFYKNTSTNVFESGTQYSLYRLVGIDKSTRNQVVKNVFEPLTIKAESIKFIDQANPVSIEQSISWNEAWRNNLTFLDWVYNTDEKNHEDNLQRIFYANILKYWINTLTFTNEFIEGLSKIQLWEWFYFFHRCKLLLALSRLSDAMGDDTAITIIYLRMGQLIKKLFPLEDDVDIQTRKDTLYSFFKKYFVLGAWKPSDIKHYSCFHEFIDNIVSLDKYILPLYKYILPKPEHNKDTLEDYYLKDLFYSDLYELNRFKNCKIDNDRVKWVYNKYRKALVLFINHENHLFEEPNKLFFRGNISSHIALINHRFEHIFIDDILKSVMTQQNSTVTIPNKLQIRSNALNFSNYNYGESTFIANSELMYSDSLDREQFETVEAFEAAKKTKTTSVSFSREKDGDAKERDKSVEEKEWNIIRHRWLHTPYSATGPSDTALFVWIMNELTIFRTHFLKKKTMPKSTKLPEPQTKTGCTWFVYQCIKDKKVPSNWKQFIDHLWNDSTGDLYKDTFPCSYFCKHFQLYCHCFFPAIWNTLFISPNQLPVPLGTTYIQQNGYIVLEQGDDTLSITKINNEKFSPLLLKNAWFDQKNILYPELNYNGKDLYYQNDQIVSLTDYEDTKSFLLFQWIQQHTERLKLIVIKKQNHLFFVRSLHPAHREWYIILDISLNRSLFHINNQMYDIIWDASWCSGLLNTIPVLCLERMHQSFLLFLLLKNELRVKNSSFDKNSDWSLDTEPSIKWIRLDDDRLDINPSETDEGVMFLYIIGVLVQNDAITSRLFSRIWRIFLWYVHRPKQPIYYDKITDLLMEQFYGSPMKKEMIRVAKALYSFVPCIKHCDTVCEPQKIFNTELFDLNMKPFTDMPKKINIKLTLKINLNEYKPLFDTIGSYLENIKHIQSKKVWKEETKEFIIALKKYCPVWEETMDRRYPLLWSILISYDKSEEAKEAMIKLWGSMLCSLLFKRLIDIIEYTSEEDTDIIDPNVKTRLLIRLQIQDWYGNLRERPLLLCMFEITAQLVMLYSQFTKSQTLFEQILNRTRPVEHILMGVGKSSVLVPWLTMRILFETDIRAIALIQPVHLMETCRNIVDRVVMPWMTDETAIVPVNHTKDCGTWWNTAKDTRWIIIGSDSDWKNLYLSVRLHKQPWFLSDELAVIYDEYDSMFAPNRSELNYSKSPQMHPICPEQLKQKRKWEQWYAKTLCALSRKKEGVKPGVKPFDDSNAVHVRHLEKLTKDNESLKKLEWNHHFGWSHLSDKQTIVPYLYVGVPLEDSQFTDVDICLLLTCTTYFINGVREEDVIKLKKKWIFMKEVENNNLKTDVLYQLAVSNQLVDSENNAEGWKNIDLVEAYLCQEVLPQNMKMVQSQWNISFVDMITTDVSPHMVGFSGTVQVKDANLLEKIVFSGIYEDKPSYKIMHDALAANNPVFIENKMTDIVKYVKRFGEGAGAHYAIIDSGSWFRQKPIEQYVDDILSADPTLIVIYLDNEDKPWKKTKNDKTRYIKPYPNEKYLYLYDQRHTVGTDIPLPSKIIGVVTVSKNTTFTEVIQGAFRLRSLTKGHEVQMIVNEEVYNEKNIKTLKETIKLLLDNDARRKKGWEYALARQSIRTRHRLITNHDSSTYHIAIYHQSKFEDSQKWAHAEFRDFKYAPYPNNYLEQDQKFFSMKDSDESNMSAHQAMDQDQNQDQEEEEEEEEEQDQAVTNIRNIQIFSKYEYVSFSKKQYLHDIYPAPKELKGMFDSLNISLSPGLLLCLHNSNLTDKYYIEKWENPERNNDNSNIKESDLTPEWISSTSRIAQVITKGKFVLWCTWNEWRLIGCPEVYTLEPEDLIPGSKRFAALLLRHLNDQVIGHASKKMIKKWIEKQQESFTHFKTLWKCKFNNFAAKNDLWSKSSIPGC